MRDIVLLVVVPLFLLLVFLYALPPIRERVNYRVEQLRLQVRYALFPPEDAVFTPQDQVAEVVQATLTAMSLVEVMPTTTPAPSATSGPTLAPRPTATPTLTPTPLPQSARLEGVRYIDQHGLFNYCAPANLAMGLSYWGWKGSREDAGKLLKPFDRDPNVMPYEMVDYVLNNTQLRALWRPAGSVELFKKMVAAGYPVIVEKGAYMLDLTGKVTWMGHYQVVTGYDDMQGQFIVQDSFYTPNYIVSYQDMANGMRSFNNVFIVIFPAEKEAEINALLGPLADEAEANRAALAIADDEKDALGGNDQYFAWFNRGTSLVRMQDFSGAAASYDQAFLLYESLPADKRPWRMLWYQTGPYFAYYYAGRYQDVVDLATLTIKNANNPYFEESYYWRGMAYLMIGKREEAVADFRQALEYHPGFIPVVGALQNLGLTP